jgi:hypothetical protein
MSVLPNITKRDHTCVIEHVDGRAVVFPAACHGEYMAQLFVISDEIPRDGAVGASAADAPTACATTAAAIMIGSMIYTL